MLVYVRCATFFVRLKGQQTVDDMQNEIQRRIDGNAVDVMATSTCPFVDEVGR